MGFIPISLSETARSISKARMSVKSIALILIHRQRRFKMLMDMTRGKKTHSITEEAAFGILGERSGLEKKNKSDNK
jgi:hypothetical protein